MQDAVRKAAMGAVVGATLGAPRRGATSFRKLNFYEPIPSRMAASEALDAWVVWSKHLRAGRRHEQIGATRAAHWLSATHEAAFGRHNLDQGLFPPMAGAYQNPLAGGADAIGRAAAWGLFFHGEPQKAVDHAAFDAACDHARDGVWAATAVAAMVAQAATGATPHSLLRFVRPLLPEGSDCARVLAVVVKGATEGAKPEELAARLPGLLPTQDPHQAALNLGYLILGLLLGSSFDETVRLVAGCGGAADHTTLAAGLVRGLIDDGPPDEWTQPLGEAYVATSCLRDIDPPGTLEQFAKQIDSACERAGAVFAAPATVPQEAPAAEESAESVVSDSSKEAIEPEPETVSQPAPTILPEWAAPGEAGLRSVVRFGDVRLELEYVDPPVARKGKTLQIVATFTYVGTAEAVVEPVPVAPGGWKVAHKLTSFRARPGESSRFPIVVDTQGAGGALELTMAGERVRVPVFSPGGWYWVGPFVNHEGMGFEKAYKAEDVQKVKQVFVGRSDLPIYWAQLPVEGPEIPLEPLFSLGPGATYLWAKARMPKAGMYRLVCAAPVGAIAWVDRKPLVKYHDTHTPIPRAILPYVAEFQGTGELQEFLVKVLRNRDEIGPMTLYFLAEDGRLSSPVDWQTMPA